MLSLCIKVSGVGELSVFGMNFSFDDFPRFYERRQVHYNNVLYVICQKGYVFIADFPFCFTEALEMHNFSLTKELNRFADIGFFNQTEDIVVGGAGFLFCGTFINTNYEGR